MGKIKTSIVFKPYEQQQLLLLPSSLDELIGPQHLVRVVNEVVERMDLTELINLYEGGGTTAYHPRMLLKVLLYAYCMKIYTGRKIARALGQDIHFMWLSAMNRPDFRTINLFRSSKAKEAIETLFGQLLMFLMDHGYIRMENYFCDGSTFRADANKHKMVWKKNAERFKAGVEQKCKELYAQIEDMNLAEDKQYGSKDLEEHGRAAQSITKEAIGEQVARLNEQLKRVTDKKKQRKAKSLCRQLAEAAERIGEYETQIQTAGKRSGYNRTDEDASAMMMKSKAEVLPAYNVLAGCEDQFITGVSLHQNTNDGSCFPEHLEAIEGQQPQAPENIIADSIFGTCQNYELLEQKGLNNYLKYPSFHNEQKQAYRNNPYLRENFIYDPVADAYTCPNQKQLVYTHSFSQTHKRTGYKNVYRQYECTDCSGCPFYKQCCRSEQGANRLLKVDEKLEVYKQQAKKNLHSEKGKSLRRQRSIEIESCFGDIKHNMGFGRFHLRGLKKVTTEFTLVAMAHNLRKKHLKLQKAAA